MMKKILLIGIYGTYNYGCEAIVRGTVNIIKSINPQTEVFYASMRGSDDRKRLKGCNVTIIDRPAKKKWTIYNVIRKLLSWVGITYVVPYDSLKWIPSDIDAVFSIGGDLYTLNPDGSFDMSLPLFLEKCQKRGMKYFLWGASVGKFDSNPSALKFFKNHLPKIDLIFVREKNTQRYLSTLGVENNVILAPDPAYYVRNSEIKKQFNSDSLTIGVNLSPLSALYEYKDMELAIQKQSEAIISLIKATDNNIVLIPHVISPSFQDNDRTYLSAIMDIVSKQYGKRITLVSDDPGFEGLSPIISQCKVVIAARMHCAVNSISVGVPALFLSYSEKAKGMSEFVYGNANNCIGLKDFENTELVLNKISKIGEIKEDLKKFDFSIVL